MHMRAHTSRYPTVGNKDTVNPQDVPRLQFLESIAAII